jgi:replication factor C large subunit
MAQTLVAWAEKYRPTTVSMLVGNEESVTQFVEWLQLWTAKRKPAKTACLLAGPPGVGKTSLARAAAHDLHFRVLEMNASDVRTEKAIEHAISPARNSVALDSFFGSTRGNLVLIDEVDGVFGREDRGGLGAILSIIDKSPIPVVLTANNVESERFLDLMKVCLTISLVEIRPRLLVALMNHILVQEKKTVSGKVVKEIARGSHGDIRSCINDLQGAVAGQRGDVGFRRTRDLSLKETLKGLLGSGDMVRSRRVLDNTEIPLYRDELLLIVHDLLPYAYTVPVKLARAYEALSRVDCGHGRVGASRSRGMMPPPFSLPRRDSAPNWSIFPFVLNDLATVGLEKPDSDIEHVLQVAPRISLKTPERYQYRLWQMDRICGRIGRALHTSKRTARSDILPFLVTLFRLSEVKGREIAAGLNLEEQDIEFLFSESKAEQVLKGTGELLDPSGFKLPYMGKDKFIQLMRVGLSYDRKSGKFVARRLDSLDSLEERVSQIISKPVKFKRTEQLLTETTDEGIIKECFVDSNSISCLKCAFVEDCPTHLIIGLKYCLCDETLAEQDAYMKYVAKKGVTLEPAAVPKKRVTRRKRN